MNKLNISSILLVLTVMAGYATADALGHTPSAHADINMEKPSILTQAPNIPAGAFPDEVDLSHAFNLEALEIQYTYSSGRAYQLRFYDDRVSFTQLEAGNIPTLTVPYRAKKIGNDMFLVHWLVPGRIGHVSLILDLDNNLIHASALMPGQMELFDGGPIFAVKRGKHML